MNKCIHCGASLMSHKHKLTPGLVVILLKVYKRICEKGENSITMKELNLDHSEFGNFQKLRFHAMIAKQEDKTWLITQRGTDFLKGKVQVPDHVETYRNRVIGHSEDYVTVSKVMKSDPYWQQIFTNKTQPVILPVEYTQDGQGLLFYGQ